ncbi:unnamed protein product, partial [Brenthis ino]
MENDDQPLEKVTIKKAVSKLNHRAPRTLQNLGRSLERVGQIVTTLDPSILDRITFESENLKESFSGSSSRRHSDDGGRAKKEFREDGTSSEPPTAGVTNYNAWNDLASSTSTTRTELSVSDGHVDEEILIRRRSHDSALPTTPIHKSAWRSTDSLAPDSAFGTSLADIMESPANKSDEALAEMDQNWYTKWRRKWLDIYEYEHSRIEPEPSFFVSTEKPGVKREEQFLVKDRYTQFSPAQRSLLVMQILLRAKYDNTDTKITIVMGAVLGTIIYRISMVSVIYGGSGFFLKRHAKIFTAMTAALINLTMIMILTRAFVIAYTSDFIPRMVYKYVYSPDNTLAGYIDHSLSY